MVGKMVPYHTRVISLMMGKMVPYHTRVISLVMGKMVPYHTRVISLMMGKMHIRVMKWTKHLYGIWKMLYSFSCKTYSIPAV
jgi:hypothetical protein